MKSNDITNFRAHRTLIRHKKRPLNPLNPRALHGSIWSIVSLISISSGIWVTVLFTCSKISFRIYWLISKESTETTDIDNKEEKWYMICYSTSPLFRTTSLPIHKYFIPKKSFVDTVIYDNKFMDKPLI